MNFTSTFRLALRALARNKMRSALTMLGIIIGVGAVIAVVSIGQGAQYMVQQRIQAMGTNVVFIAAGSGRPGGIKTTCVPMAWIPCWTMYCAPWPMLTTAITAPTPMMMPSMVSADRILFRASARSASRNVLVKFIGHF